MTKMTVALDDDHAARLDGLARRTGLSAEAVVAEAPDAYAGALEESGRQPTLTPDEIAAIEAGLAAIERGEVVDHDDLFRRLEAKPFDARQALSAVTPEA